jgi:hypothetical protein
MADLNLQGRKTFKVFNQEFIVDERYVVTKELGQGAYGIVWYAPPLHAPTSLLLILIIFGVSSHLPPTPTTVVDPKHLLTYTPLQCSNQPNHRRGRSDQEGHKCVQQEDSRQARIA